MNLPLAQLHLSPPLMMLSIFAVNGTAYLHPFLNLPPRHPSTTRPFYTSSKRPTERGHRIIHQKGSNGNNTVSHSLTFWVSTEQ